MRLFVPLAIAQLLFIIVILSMPIQSRSASVVRHVAKTVLGTSIIADDASLDTPTNTPTPTDGASSTSNQPQNTPTDTPTPVVIDTTGQSIDTNQPDQVTLSPEPATQSGQVDNSSRQTSTPDSNDQSLLQNTLQTEMQQNATPTATQTDEANLTPIPTDQQANVSSNTPLPIDNANQDVSSDTNQSSDITSNIANSDVLLDPQSVITNTSSINAAIVNDVTNQDVAVNNDQSPEQKVVSLQTFVKDNVVSINNQITRNNFSSTALLSQQLNKQLDTLSTDLATLPLQSKGQAESKIRSLCSKAAVALRTEAMVVPEDLEQDIITNEAKCYNLSL